MVESVQRHTVLVIDDEPDVVKSVKDLLRYDYRVLGATSPREGMGILQKEEIQVVLTDQRMPEMTGVEFLFRLRGEFPDAIRIIFTGYADVRAIIDAINQGNVFRYVVKPWDPEELQCVIREACERYDMIVERRRLIEQLQQKNEELEKANAEIRKADTIKYNFVQLLSHELRTPLSISLMLARIAANFPGVQTNVLDCLSRIEQANRRIERLTRQLSTVIDAWRSDGQVHRQSVDLTGLLNLVAEDIRPFVTLRHQTLTLDIPSDLGTFELDGQKIVDSVEQLLLNAIKFTLDEGKISLNARRLPDGGVEIGVSDTGIGIDAAHLSKVFEPLGNGFDLMHHSSGMFEFGRKGLGLGLTVVKHFVEMHGGTVKMESKVDAGTTFTIVLPVTALDGQVQAAQA